MEFKGNVFRYGRDIDTDVIIPARYLNTSDAQELAKHCMEDLDTTFTQRVQPGDIIVAEENLGCGSSREHAPIAIKAAGVSCVIAEKFARIFYRNAINIGLPVIVCRELPDVVKTGDEMELSMTEGSMFRFISQRIWLDTSLVNLHQQEHSEAMQALRHLSNRKEKYYGSNS